MIPVAARGPDTAVEGQALPEGWVRAQIGEIVRLVNGFAFKPSHWKGTGLPIIRIQNLNNPQAPFNYCPDPIPDKFLVETGDLLFAWSGTPGTSFGAHIWTGPRGLLNQHIFRVEFDRDLFDERFLRLAINQNLLDYIEQAHGGVGLAHITKGKFESSTLLLPPLAEQRRIVAQIEALLVRLSRVRDRLTRTSEFVGRLRQAAVISAMSGNLTADWRTARPESASPDDALPTSGGRRVGTELRRLERILAEVPPLPEFPSGWRLVRIGDVSDRLQYGTSSRADAKAAGGVPILRMGNIQDGRLDLSDLKFIADQPQETSAFLLELGDLLFNRTNSPELVGKAAVYAADLRAVFASYLVRVQLNKGQADPRFVCYWVNSPWGREWASAVRTDGVSQSNINATKLAEMPVPLPALVEQQEIVRRVEALFALADAVGRRVRAASLRTEQLTQAILAKAFRGELVPTEAEMARQEGRDYEPGEALLARVRAEQPRVPVKRNGRVRVGARQLRLV